MSKAIIFAPFWRQAGHVGNNRVDRFLRWLSGDGFEIVMVRAGSMDGRLEESWGTEITVHDPLGLYRDASLSGMMPPARKPNKLRRSLAYWLFNPDPSVVWARVAARHPAVLEAAAGADFILSSSPPESAHVGAWKLSRRLGLPHIVDMRDGWLDEPLRPLLRDSALRRWLEGRLENRILSDASAILVTSDVWQELLTNRLPGMAEKVCTLTNGYPQAATKMGLAERDSQDVGLVLVHAGRFFGSDTRRTPDIILHILQPLLDVLSQRKGQGTIKLIGSLTTYELEIVKRFVPPFAELGWRIECPGSLPRHEILRLLPEADGLLLLSASHAAIPSKLFEYIPTKRPILAVTERGSAVWRIAEKLPQAFLLELSGADDGRQAVNDFLEAAAQNSGHWLCPEEFSEASLAVVLRKLVAQIMKNSAAL